MLLVKIIAIGDVLMTIAAVRRLRLKNFTWVCGKSVEPLIKHFCPECKTIPVSEKDLFAGNLFGKIREISRIWLCLGGSFFDRAVVLHRDRRYGFLIPPWTTSHKVILDGKERETMLVPGRYHADEYFRVLSGSESEDKGTTDFPLEQCPVAEEIEALLASAKTPRVMIAPAGARNILRDNPLRRWPLENYVRLARIVIEKGGSVTLVGGPDDRHVCAAFVGLAVHDLVGKTDLLGSLGVFQRADWVVTHDSGPLHLALASGSRVIALFGPTDPGNFAPKAERVKVLWGGANLGCRPCYDGRDYAPCTSNDCLKQITAEDVVRHIDFKAG